MLSLLLINAIGPIIPCKLPMPLKVDNSTELFPDFFGLLCYEAKLIRNLKLCPTGAIVGTIPRLPS